MIYNMVYHQIFNWPSLEYKPKHNVDYKLQLQLGNNLKKLQVQS